MDARLKTRDVAFTRRGARLFGQAASAAEFGKTFGLRQPLSTNARSRQN